MKQQKAVAGKSMIKILKYLPRATSSVTFRNPPLYSPAKDKKSSEKTHKSNLGIGFSGPMLSIVPSENRRKIKNESKSTILYEPTSPRVSCMGQVKCKHYRKLTGAGNITQKPNNTFSRTTSYTPVRTYNNNEVDQEKNKKKSGFRSLFSCGSRRKCDDATNEKSTVGLTIPKGGPCSSTMKRFSSGRDVFKSFDWTTQVAPVDSDNRNCFTDEERDGGSDGDEVMVPSSAPVMVRNKGIGDNFIRVGGVKVEPRKEVNLWKRRAMAQPKPLQVHVTD